MSVGPEDFRNVRAAPPANWAIRFAVVFVLTLPVYLLGLTEPGGQIGGSLTGAAYSVVVVLGASIWAGIRMSRYTFSPVATPLRWGATVLGAFFSATLLTAMIAGAAGL